MTCWKTVVDPLRIVGLASHNSYGGAQSALKKLMNALAKRGHSTELWFLYRTSSGHETEAPDARLLVPHPVQGAWGYLQVALALHRALRQARPDALVSFLPLANVLGQTLATTGGIQARVASQRNPNWTYERSMQILDKVAGTIGIYGRTVCVSGVVRDSFRRYPAAYQRRLMVVSNGLELRPAAIDKATARLALGLPRRAFVVAIIGRLCVQKNLKLVLDAAARAPGAILVFAGHGEERTALQMHAQMLGITERIVFVGRLAAARVPELLAASDVFAQPSLFEGQSNALLEAMAAGLPVLASDIPSQRETLVDDTGRHCGILLPLGDPERWAEALQRLQTDDEERRALGCAAAIRSKAFTVERMAIGFEAAIAAACAGKHTIDGHTGERRHQEKAGPSNV